MIDFPILYERSKGPRTPNFRKMSVMLREGKQVKISIDGRSVMIKHGAVGIKMCFVCDTMEKLEQLNDEVEAWREGRIVYTKKKEFYDFIFHLDTYIFGLYSVLDYFALEIGEILRLEKEKRGKFVGIEYFTDLKSARGFDQNTLVIKQKAADLSGQFWYEYFHDMRNRIVHMLPIGLRALMYGNTIEFPFLPDEPKNPDSLSEKKLDPLTECKKWLEGVFCFVDGICLVLGKQLFDNFET